MIFGTRCREKRFPANNADPDAYLSTQLEPQNMQTNRIKGGHPQLPRILIPGCTASRDSYQPASAQQTWLKAVKCARGQVPGKRNTLFNPLTANWRTDVGADTLNQSVSQSDSQFFGL